MLLLCLCCGKLLCPVTALALLWLTLAPMLHPVIGGNVSAFTLPFAVPALLAAISMWTCDFAFGCDHWRWPADDAPSLSHLVPSQIAGTSLAAAGLTALLAGMKLDGWASFDPSWFAVLAPQYINILFMLLFLAWLTWPRAESFQLLICFSVVTLVGEVMLSAWLERGARNVPLWPALLPFFPIPCTLLCISIAIVYADG
jgi:hypothetical protein